MRIGMRLRGRGKGGMRWRGSWLGGLKGGLGLFLERETCGNLDRLHSVEALEAMSYDHDFTA